MRKIGVSFALLILSLGLLYRRYLMAPESPKLLDSVPANPEKLIKLDVSTGESVSLYDQLGPTVVAADGVRLSPARSSVRVSSDDLHLVDAFEDCELGRVRRGGACKYP